MEHFTIFLAFILSSVGCTHVFIDGSIFANFRAWIAKKNIPWLTNLSTCYLCLGWHVSAWLSLVMQPLPYPWYVNFFVCGCIGSFVSMLGAALLNYLDRPWGSDGNKA